MRARLHKVIFLNAVKVKNIRHVAIGDLYERFVFIADIGFAQYYGSYT